MEAQAAGNLPRWPFRFDAEKALEAVILVASRISAPTFHSISKVLYHADRQHMDEYARPISGDWYAAMKHGPVPSRTYNILKTIKGVENVELPGDAASALTIVNGKEVVANREPKLDVLSQSEIECLEQSIKQNGEKSFGKRTKESHDAAWKAVDENEQMELQHFLLTLRNADSLREHFQHE